MSDPDVIYLQPDCGEWDDRTWCLDNVWPDDCDSGPSGIKYIRFDLHESALRANAEAARRDGAQWMLDGAISVCIDNGQRELAAKIRAAVTVPPHPADPALKQDHAIAAYFGVTIEEVRKVRAAAQQKDPTP